ncbi:hypothetical protein GF360_00690 [candidate division WWE3 bacterium]|nr:hypothetical protein [candidate division WWE3 bacterium]
MTLFKKAFVFLYVAFFTGGVVLADDEWWDTDLIENLFAAIYRILLPGAIIIGLVLIVVNGYGMLTSEGDPRKVQSARENLTSAIIGLAFVLSAVAIYRVVVTGLFDTSF